MRRRVQTIVRVDTHRGNHGRKVSTIMLPAEGVEGSLPLDSVEIRHHDLLARSPVFL